MQQLVINTTFLKKFGPAIMSLINDASSYSFVKYKTYVLVLNVIRNLDFDVTSVIVEHIICDEPGSDRSFLTFDRIVYHHKELIDGIEHCQNIDIKPCLELTKIPCFKDLVEML